MNLQVLACRKCRAVIPARERAVTQAQYSRRVLFDLACDACGHRALYELGQGPGH